ncbi:MAG: hypothetical protein Q8L98_05090 [Chlamydiales bacterium]|nr:hypothetical protein [Chlamydiales bacterium]
MHVSRPNSKVTVTNLNEIDEQEDPAGINDNALPDGFVYLDDNSDDGSGLGYVRSSPQPSTPNKPTPTSTPNKPTPAPEPYFSYFRKLLQASSKPQAPTPLNAQVPTPPPSTPASASVASSSTSEPAPSTKPTKATSSEPISSATNSALFSKEEQDQIDLANYFSKHPERLFSESSQNTQDLLNGLLSIYRNKITTCDLDKEKTKNALKSFEDTIEKFETVVTQQAKLLNRPLVIVRQTPNKEIPEFRKTSPQSQQPQIIYREKAPTIKQVSEDADNLRQHQQQLTNVKRESTAALVEFRRMINLNPEKLEAAEQKLTDILERKTQIEKEAKKDILNPSLSLSQCIEQFNKIVQLYQEIPENQRILKDVPTPFSRLKDRLIKFEEQIVNRAAKENKVEELNRLRSLANKEDRIFLEASNEFEALGPEERLFWESKLEELKKQPHGFFYNRKAKNEIKTIEDLLSAEESLLTANDLKYYETLCNNISRLYRQLPSDAQRTEKGEKLFNRLVSFQQQVIERALKENATIEILSPLSDELHNSPEGNIRILLNEEIPLKDRIISFISPYSRKEISNISYVTQDLVASGINTAGFGIRFGWQTTKNLAVASAPWTGAYAMQYINDHLIQQGPFDEAGMVEGLLNCPPNVITALIAFSALALTYNNAPKLPEGTLSSLSHTGPLAIKTAIKTAGFLLAGGVAASTAGVIDGPAIARAVGSTAIGVGGSVLKTGLGVIPVPNLSNISEMYSGSNIEALAHGIYDNGVAIGIGSSAALTAAFLIRSLLALNHSKSNSIPTVQGEEKPNEANKVGAKEAEKEEEGTNPAPSADGPSLDQVPSTNGTPPLATTSSKTRQVANVAFPLMIGLAVALGSNEHTLETGLNETLPGLAANPESVQVLTTGLSDMVKQLLPTPAVLEGVTREAFTIISDHFTEDASDIISTVSNNQMIVAAILATVIGVETCRRNGITLSSVGSSAKVAAGTAYNVGATVVSGTASGAAAIGSTAYNVGATVVSGTASGATAIGSTAYNVGATVVSGATSTIKSLFSWSKKPVEAAKVDQEKTESQKKQRSSSPQNTTKNRGRSKAPINKR